MPTSKKQVALEKAQAQSLIEQGQHNENSYFKNHEKLARNLERESLVATITDVLLPGLDRGFQLVLQLFSELNVKRTSYITYLVFTKQISKECYTTGDILMKKFPSLQSLFLLFNKLYLIAL
jgi:hypothetical protein